MLEKHLAISYFYCMYYNEALDLFYRVKEKDPGSADSILAQDWIEKVLFTRENVANDTLLYKTTNIP